MISEDTNMTPLSLMTASFIGTSNRGFAAYALEELRRIFPKMTSKIIVPAEILIYTIPGDRDEAFRLIHEHQPVFLRHIQPIDAEIELTQSMEDVRIIERWCREQHGIQAGDKVAVQIRKKEGLHLPYETAELRGRMETALLESVGVVPVVKEAERIVSVYIDGDKAFVGTAKADQQLSDWPGGAVRFQREEGQISRAKFKLLEAERTFGLDFTNYRNALDVGAAPGGWTSLLLERGLSVTAIDPAALDPSLKGNPKLTYLAKNAGDVHFKPDTFDLLVCDMSWSPRQMEKLVVGLLPALQTGGTAIITIKLMHKKPFQTMKELHQAFGEHLNIQGMKQLFHNREEFTLFAVKK
jgi:23S rRNA (cytidine2498-2'-O)-methyltransferase